MVLSCFALLQLSHINWIITTMTYLEMNFFIHILIKVIYYLSVCKTMFYIDLEIYLFLSYNAKPWEEIGVFHVHIRLK